MTKRRKDRYRKQRRENRTRQRLRARDNEFSPTEFKPELIAALMEARKRAEETRYMTEIGLTGDLKTRYPKFTYI